MNKPTSTLVILSLAAALLPWSAQAVESDSGIARSKIEEAARDTRGAERVLDGSAVKDSAVSAPEYESLGRGPASAASADLGKTEASAQKKDAGAPPEPSTTFPSRDDDEPASEFGKKTKSKIKGVATSAGQLGAIGGMVAFLFGIVTFNPALMIIGAMVAGGAVLMGGLAQIFL